jgi:hypothetical protein
MVQYKPIAASFTMVVELVLLSMVFFTSVMVYESVSGDESIIMTSTLAMSFIASLVNMVVFIVCALQRKSSVLRGYYYQSITQATYSVILISMFVYFSVWVMALLDVANWKSAFFMVEPPSVRMHDSVGVIVMAFHVILVFVAGLGTYSCTPEGSVNLLWMNPAYIVSLSVVWCIVVEVAEFGAMHCYGVDDTERPVIYITLNVTFSMFFLLHMLDSMNVSKVFGWKIPEFFIYTPPLVEEVYDEVMARYAEVLYDITQTMNQTPEQFETNLSAGSREEIEDDITVLVEASDVLRGQRPVVYLWRFCALFGALCIATIPWIRILLSSRHTMGSDQDFVIFTSTVFTAAGVGFFLVVMAVDYIEVLHWIKSCGKVSSDDILMDVEVPVQGDNAPVDNATTSATLGYTKLPTWAGKKRNVLPWKVKQAVKPKNL